MSPIVAYVAHEDCSVSGNVYYVADGRGAGIFVAETQGVVLPDISAAAVHERVTDIDQSRVTATTTRPRSTRRTTTIAKALSEGLDCSAVV